MVKKRVEVEDIRWALADRPGCENRMWVDHAGFVQQKGLPDAGTVPQVTEAVAARLERDVDDEYTSKSSCMRCSGIVFENHCGNRTYI